jgi:hypothetical protein
MIHDAYLFLQGFLDLMLFSLDSEYLMTFADVGQMSHFELSRRLSVKRAEIPRVRR